MAFLEITVEKWVPQVVKQIQTEILKDTQELCKCDQPYTMNTQ